MKNILLTLGMLFLYNFTIAQDLKFTVEVNRQEVLMGNYFEVKFTLENSKGDNFSPPDFSSFHIIGGPNQSSAYSMMNGAVSQSVTYSYYLEPKEVGNYFIEAASIETEDGFLETLPVEIIVSPNPEGIKQDAPGASQKMDFFFDFNWPSDVMPGDGRGKQDPAKKKKKRKIYKM